MEQRTGRQEEAVLHGLGTAIQPFEVTGIACLYTNPCHVMVYGKSASAASSPRSCPVGCRNDVKTAVDNVPGSWILAFLVVAPC